MNESRVKTGFLAVPARVGALLVVLCLAVAGCGPLLQNPEVRILDLSVTGLGLFGGTAQVVVEVDNPNRMGLEVRSLDYLIEVSDPRQTEGQEVRWDTLAAGVHADTVKVGGRTTETVTLSIPFRYQAVGTAFRAWLEGGTIPYRVEGDVLARGLIGERQYPFSNIGSFRP